MPTIKVYKFGPAFGLPDASPFVMKVETYLRITDQKYETITGDVRKAPRKQLPFVEIDGKIIPDSTAIVDSSRRRGREKLDAHLDARQRAVGQAFKSMLEEHLYFCLLYMRWATDDGLGGLRAVAPRDARHDGRARPAARHGGRSGAQVHGGNARSTQGVGRQPRAEVVGPRNRIIDALVGAARRRAVLLRRQADDLRRHRVRVRGGRALPGVRQRGAQAHGATKKNLGRVRRRG